LLKIYKKYKQIKSVKKRFYDLVYTVGKAYRLSAGNLKLKVGRINLKRYLFGICPFIWQSRPGDSERTDSIFESRWLQVKSCKQLVIIASDSTSAIRKKLCSSNV